MTGRDGESRALSRSATALLLVAVAVWSVRKTTWYLAVDQYGYLSFAHDLAHGRVLHRCPPLEALASRLPVRTDVLFQTWVLDHGRVYSRYAPGFPLLLAGWMTVFGEDGAHYLNVVVLVALLAVLRAMARKIFASEWQALAAVALAVLPPNYLDHWALTVVRDLPTHLAALTALCLLVSPDRRPLGGRRAAAAGLALGFAVSIRPDAALYLVPALLLATTRLRSDDGARARAAVLVFGLVLGVSPLLAYDWVATGNPLHVTQGMEAESLFAAAAKSPGADGAGVRAGPGGPTWHGGTGEAVEGGGLRLANLPRTLPAYLGFLRGAYGDGLLGIGAWGALIALARRRVVFLVAAPYSALALVFFGCWLKPDPRYLSGLLLLLPLLVVEGAFGTLALLRRLSERGMGAAARIAAMSAAVLFLLAAMPPSAALRDPSLAANTIVPVLVAAGALAAALSPSAGVSARLAPLIALVLTAVAVGRATSELPERAPFQRPEMLHARATVSRVLGAGAVLLTTEDIGRPAENIEWYSGAAHALYLTDLERWHLPLADALGLLLRAGMTPHLLLPADAFATVDALRPGLEVDIVATVPAHEAISWFVSSRFLRGLPLALYRVGARPPAPSTSGQAAEHEPAAFGPWRMTSGPRRRGADELHAAPGEL